MLKSDQIIKHDRFMDVCFYVHRVHQLRGWRTYTEVLGEWVNLGASRSYAIGERDSFIIREQDLVNWKVCLDPDIECLRSARWV